MTDNQQKSVDSVFYDHYDHIPSWIRKIVSKDIDIDKLLSEIKTDKYGLMHKKTLKIVFKYNYIQKYILPKLAAICSSE